MPGFLSNLLRMQRQRRGTDMRFLCRHLLSEAGDASQTALAQQIINSYRAMNSAQRLAFFEMLCREFSPDEAGIRRAIAEYQRTPGPITVTALSAAVEAPRQELIRRINTARHGNAGSNARTSSQVVL
jgi:malonyl-CoA decarboxylase